MRFESKVVVVTGAAQGIGEVAVARFAREGAKVVAVDLNSEVGEASAARLRKEGLDVSFFRASVAEEADVRDLYAFVKDKFNRVDVLFNNAGVGLESYGATTTLEDWHKVLSVNLDGVFLMARGAIEFMLASGEGGAIVNTSSICGHIAEPGATSYNTSKHAIEGLTKSLAIEHAKDNIRVNTVCPGYVNTPMGQADVAADPTIPERHPVGRLAEPEEIVAPVLFLASDEASFITGTSLLVDGGYTAR